MAIHYRTQGIILKKENRGEVDQLFTIYTKELGKLEILGKAIRKIKSKLRAGAELFYFSEIEFIQGKTYKTLTDAILIDKFENIRNDLNKLKIVYKISDVLDNLIKGQEPDQKTWNFLKETFEKLDKLKIACPVGPAPILGAGPFGENCKLKIIYYYFLWNLLSVLGYQPELYNCAVCQKRLKPEKLFFSLENGGITCSDCKRNLKLIIEIEPETIKILRIILKQDWSTLKRLKIEKPHLEFLNKVSQQYYSYIRKIFVIS